MAELLVEVDRVLIPSGTLALLFNARDADSWKGLVRDEASVSLSYYGCFPMTYSANSVVQDNRQGAMKTDYVLIYRKQGAERRNISFEKEVRTIPGWSEGFPQAKG
jgi:adenine-specific DNA methylase